MPIRTASARWEGNLTEGSGTIKTGKGGYQGNYSFKSRFEEGEGTNPEELIAAAHAACFSMAFANILAEAGHEAESVSTTAKVQLRPLDGKPTIAKIELTTVGVVPGIDEATFQQHAADAKKGCPVSRALASVPEITLEATLAS